MMGPHYGHTVRHPHAPRRPAARPAPLPSVIIAPDPARPSPMAPSPSGKGPGGEANEPTLVLSATARRLRSLHDQLPSRIKIGTLAILLLSILVFAAGVARWVSRPTTAMLDAHISERR
jgi:hypothetical protein